MRRLVKSVPRAAAILITGCLATACAQAASGAVIRDSPSPSAPATATAPPTSAAPSLTPTIGPSTVFTTITPTPTSPTTPATNSPASSSGSGADLIWLWVILGALALLGIILWATRRPSRPPAPVPGPVRSSAAGWHNRAADAYAQGAALDGAVRAAAGQGAFVRAAGEQWYEIRSLADELADRLYAMRETAPNAERHAQVVHALGALEEVRYAVDAEPTITVEDEGAQQEAALHSSLLALESALNTLRVPEGRYQ